MPKGNRFYTNIFAEKNFFYSFYTYFKNNLVPIILIVSLAIVIIVSMFYSYFPMNLKIREGDIASQDIVANRTISYVDVAKTEMLREKMVESVSPVYLLDKSKESEALKNIDGFFNSIKSILSDNKSVIEKRKKIVVLLSGNTQLADSVLSESVGNIEELQKTLKSIMYKLMILGIRSDKISQSTDVGIDEINKLKLKKDEKTLMIYVLQHTIQPNMIYDKDATEKAIEQAKKTVSPVTITITKGETIVKKGDKITAEQAKILKTLGIIHTKDDWKVIISIIAFVIIFLLISFFAVKKSTAVRSDNTVKKTTEFIIIVVVVYLLSMFLETISPYLVPIPLLTMLIFAFFDFSTALTVTVAFSFLLSLSLDLKSPIIFAIIVASIVVLFLMKKMSRMLTLIYSGIIGGFTFSFLALFIGLSSKLPVKQIGLNMLYGFTNFFAVSVIAVGMIFIMDHTFNEVTLLRLLELGDTSNSLLKELLLKAPGTYQHSMAVANLASAAAEEIGANAPLARVGAYYHDIGKMLHPYFFTENQQTIPNIHNELSPNLSKTVIINHVKNGIQLAKKYRLPQEITGFIATHHGTTVVSYFYHKSKEEGKIANKDDFRYPGPLPYSKETGIVMLADAVEAATHSIPVSDYNKFKEIVNSIIKNRVEDGQLDETDLTLKDLKDIKDSFVRTLISLYHTREKYPEENENRDK